MFQYFRLKNGYTHKASLLILFKFCCIFLFSICFASCASNSSNYSNYPLSGKSYVQSGKRYHILAAADGYKEKGMASWYGKPFHGRKTASGEIYNMYEVSAAHKTLPLHCMVEVKNLANNKSMVVRINDRGPFIDGRIIDLSHAAAQYLDVLGPGVVPVTIKVVGMAKNYKPNQYLKNNSYTKDYKPKKKSLYSGNQRLGRI